MATDQLTDCPLVVMPPADEPSEATQGEQYELLRATLASIGDAVITADARGRITFLNPAAQSLTGWAPEKAAGVPLEIVFRIVGEVATAGSLKRPRTAFSSWMHAMAGSRTPTRS